MIEINLSPTKKAAGLTNIAGIDLSLINVKMMVIALLVMFVPEPILVGIWDEEIAGHNSQFASLNSEYRKLQTKVRSMQNVQKQVDALKEQEGKLDRKLETVKKIINKRQNPFQVLRYVAENIPSEVWLQSIELVENSLILTGYATNYKNIGVFIESLKNSIFFQAVDYQNMQDLNPVVKGRRLETFKITTQVVRFK